MLIQLLSAGLLVSCYVYLYYDYLQTVTANEMVSISTDAAETYQGAALGVVVIHEEVFVSPSR
jgi:hypothetical protein